METEEQQQYEWQPAPEPRKKPDLEPITRPPNWGRTVFSIALFIALFMLIGVDLMLILALIVVLLIHEGGHFVAMRMFGYKNVNMFFVPFLGAFVSGERRDVPGGAEIIMLLAGPVPGILIGSALLIWHPNKQVIELGGMFLLINLFNMFPFYPLDGGRIMERLFARENLHIRIGLLVLSILALAGFVFYTRYFILGILGFGIVQQITYSLSMIRLRQEMKEKGLNYLQTYTELSDEEYDRFFEFVKKKYPELHGEQEIAHRVAALMAKNTTDSLGFVESAMYFLAWLFFLVGPVYIVFNLFGSQLTEALLSL